MILIARQAVSEPSCEGWRTAKNAAQNIADGRLILSWLARRGAMPLKRSHTSPARPPRSGSSDEERAVSRTLLVSVLSARGASLAGLASQASPARETPSASATTATMSGVEALQAAIQHVTASQKHLHLPTPASPPSPTGEPRPTSRPPASQPGPHRQIAVTISAESHRLLRVRAAEDEVTFSDVVDAALQSYLGTK